MYTSCLYYSKTIILHFFNSIKIYLNPSYINNNFLITCKIYKNSIFKDTKIQKYPSIAFPILLENNNFATHKFTKYFLCLQGLRDISELWSYQYFQYIDLSWNEICDLSAISTLYLMCLDVSHNKLTTVLQFKPPWFLTHVNLSCNEIKEISDLSDFWSLRHLNFSYNMIKKIEGLQNLKSVLFLHIITWGF